MQSLFDLIAPVAVELVDLLRDFWGSLLLAAIAVVAGRRGWRVPSLPAPRRWIAYTIVCALSLGCSAVTLSLRGLPSMPGLEDDFGYLLTADTFLHGRLTNPPHPLMRHFDAWYTLSDPTYSSIFLPGNGAVLALGRLITGRAIAGMWLASMLAVAAILWALRGWVSDGWAFALGCLAAVHPTMASWSDSYHGGGLSACGGALMAGAVGRLRRRAPRVSDGIAFGAGAALLELTRPYEGFAVGAAFTVVVLASTRGRRLLRPAVAAVLIVAAATGVLMAHDRAVTGHALKLPYALSNDRVLSAPNFIWQPPRPMPHYPHEEYARVYRQFRSYYLRTRQPREFARTALAETVELLRAAVPTPGPDSSGFARVAASLWLLELLPLAVFAGVAVRRDGAASIAFVLAIALASLLQVTWWTQTHYAAPATGAFAVALAVGLVHLNDRHGWLARAAFAAMIVAAMTTIAAVPPFVPSDRTRFVQALRRSPGPHLVLVPEGCYHLVHNGAEVDAQEIIWARELGNDRDLLQRYADRTVWEVRCESAPSRLARLRPPLRPPARREYERDPYVP